MVSLLVGCLANLVGGGEFREFPKNVSKDKLGALGGFSQSGLVVAACSLLVFEMVQLLGELLSACRCFLLLALQLLLPPAFGLFSLVTSFLFACCHESLEFRSLCGLLEGLCGK